MRDENQNVRLLNELASDAANALLGMKDFRTTILDFDRNSIQMNKLIQAWMHIHFQKPFPEGSEVAFDHRFRQSLEETISQNLFLAVYTALWQALEFATSTNFASVMPSHYKQPATSAILQNPLFAQRPEGEILDRFAERILQKAVLQVSLNEQETANAFAEYYAMCFRGHETRDEAETKWETLSAKQKKVLKKKMGDNPLEKVAEIIEARTALSDDEKERMEVDLAECGLRFFYSNIDHVVRVAIVANLLLSVVYGEYTLDLALGKKAEAAAQSLPSIEELKAAIGEIMLARLVNGLPTRPRPGRQASADYTELSKFYKEVLKDWHEAYRFCQEALSSDSSLRKAEWKEAIKKYYPRLRDCEDLIERLRPRHVWPQEILEKADNQAAPKRADSAPEHIALEHAARLCGGADYACKLSTLRKYLSNAGI